MSDWFNPFSGAPAGATKPLPPRPQAPNFLNTLQQRSAAVAAEAPLEEQKPSQEHNPVNQPTLEVIPMSEEINLPVTAAATNSAAEVAAADAAIDAAAGADERTPEDLPAKAGIVDYRTGEGLPITMMPVQVEELAKRIDGLSIQSVFPVTHKTPAIVKETGLPRVSKNGKQVMKTSKVPTNVSALFSGEQNMNWLLDSGYAVRLIAEQMLFRVQGHMAAQGLSFKENWVFTSDWLNKHFGTDNFQDAVEAELRPWAATKVSTLSAAQQANLCSSTTDAQEIIAIYEYVSKAAETYLSKVLKGKGSKSEIASQLAPITKAQAKWEQWVTRCEKALAAGKPEPKAPMIKSLTSETPKGIRAVVAMLLTADTKRQAMAEKFKTGNYPERFTAEDVQAYIDGTTEYSINMQTVACWLGQIATNMQATEQRKLQKYAAESAATVDDDFDMI